MRPFRIAAIGEHVDRSHAYWAHAMRPYIIVDEDDPVKMVRHHDRFVQFDFLTNLCRSQPFPQYNLPQGRQSRLAIGDLRQD